MKTLANPHPAVSDQAERALADLRRLVTFPGVSSEGFTSPALSETASYLAGLCRESGFDQVNQQILPGSAPYVLARAFSPDPDAPRILVYAHYDVQPVGKTDLWQSPPFVATVRDGRMYGRGTADDKVGVIAAIAAVRSFRESGRNLPVNVTLLLDGEEESGSPHMAAFLKAHGKDLAADYLIVPDMVNPSLERPAIIFCLRGLIEFRVRYAYLEKAIHSGLGGGVVPDVTQLVAERYAALLKPNGSLKLRGGKKGALPQEVLSGLKKLPRKKTDYGLLPQAQFLQKNVRKFYEALWFAPALTMINLQVGEGQQHANRIQAGLEATFSFRVPAQLKTAPFLRFLRSHFTKNLPHGCRAEWELVHSGEGFFTDPEALYFRKALAAVSAATGKRAVAYGAGLTVPFVHLLQTELGRVKTVLLGVEDPHSNAHAENESVALSAIDETICSLANLFAAFAEKP